MLWRKGKSCIKILAPPLLISTEPSYSENNTSKPFLLKARERVWQNVLYEEHFQFLNDTVIQSVESDDHCKNNAFFAKFDGSVNGQKVTFSF